ncbi:MAG: hypothetical protein COV52_02795 [Gammaproteobacteria bacterium CG11_big_fil_rev_8_21_14_0_20_46_22]|nr:MAG: hypothetical protein COW05_08830 [Gammaproteobacteria bacterium CG12_big_fil_rev_8_21_14_0_65_46_12]PIR11705.1 MAG: hypothetical protein COV52_02795 [Gammaproteobacteria bacterium CG11_big_fil_rev_8_21_14_0_20_46_22]
MNKLTLSLVAAGALLASGSAMATLTTNNQSNLFSNVALDGKLIESSYGTPANTTKVTSTAQQVEILNKYSCVQHACTVTVYALPSSTSSIAQGTVVGTGTLHGVNYTLQTTANNLGIKLSQSGPFYNSQLVIAQTGSK